MTFCFAFVTTYVFCSLLVTFSAGPCRPLCQRVKRACLQILQNFNLPWPEALNCDRLVKKKTGNSHRSFIGRFPPMNNHEHMCMDGDNLAPENRLDNLKCKCFSVLSRLSHLSHRVSHLSKTLSHLDFQRNTWSRDDLGRSWRILGHQLLASLSRPYKEVSGSLQETPRA